MHTFNLQPTIQSNHPITNPSKRKPDVDQSGQQSHTTGPRSTAAASMRPWAAVAAIAVFLPLTGCKPNPAAPTDQSLTDSVQSRLSADTALSGAPIQSSAASGIVTLNGTVPNAAARALASDDAAQVAGVRTVINNLTIQPGSQTASQRDEQLRHQAAAAPRTDNPPSRDANGESSRSRPSPNTPQQTAADRAAQHQSAGSQPGTNPSASNQSIPTQPPAPIVRPGLNQNNTQAGTQANAQPVSAPRTITLPSGTAIAVRMSQGLDSATTQPDDIFKGTLASDINVDGILVLPQGTPVLGRVLTVQEAAHFKGDSLLTITLTEIDRNSAPLKVSTDSFSKSGTGRGKNTVEKVGGGAALGALLGGLFGGGKGAAIGALAGGGAGAGVNAATRGQQVQIPTETVVRFSLAKDLTVPIRGGSSQPLVTPGLQRRPENPVPPQS